MIVSNDMLHDSRVNRHAEAFGMLGHEVTVICSASIMSQVQFEHRKHYNILRVRSRRALIARELFHAKRNGNILSDVQSSARIAFLILLARIGLYLSAFRARADVYYSNDLDTLDIGVAMKLIGRRLIYDSHELYVEMLPVGTRRRICALFERLVVNFADVILTVNPYIASELHRRYKTKKEVNVVLNCPDQPVGQALTNSRLDDKRIVTVLYHGRLDHERGLENLVVASKMFHSHVRLLIRGEGELEERLRQLAQDSVNVHFEKSVPLERVVEAASEADVGIIPYLATNLNQFYCSPNKLFEFIQAGLAVAGSDLPFLRKIVKENNIGEVFNASDPADIARKVNFVASIKNLRKFKQEVLRVRDRYTWNVEREKLYEACRDLHL